MGARPLFLVFLLLAGSASAQPVGTETSSAPAKVSLSAADFPNAPNLRDLGGYETADGGKIRPGLVYRSDQIDRLSNKEVQRLASLGIAIVVDLRTMSERSREPDRLPPDASYVVADVMADAPEGVDGDMMATLTRAIAAGGAVRRLEEANRAFVSSPAARQAYALLLRQVIAANGRPLLFHCTAGKDRTGWAAALLFTIAGVPREEVFRDYLASTDLLAAKNRQTLASLEKHGLNARERAELDALLTVRRSFLAAAFAEVEHRYGSFDRYLQEGLALDLGEVEKLRHLLVMPKGD
ncbi:MAG: tyrosine-protein phosphatase [Sphingobium sp.]